MCFQKGGAESGAPGAPNDPFNPPAAPRIDHPAGSPITPSADPRNVSRNVPPALPPADARIAPPTTPRLDPDLAPLLAALGKLPDSEQRDLMRLVESWPTLPPAIKAGIVAMVGAADLENRR